MRRSFVWPESLGMGVRAHPALGVIASQLRLKRTCVPEPMGVATRGQLEPWVPAWASAAQPSLCALSARDLDVL